MRRYREKNEVDGGCGSFCVCPHGILGNISSCSMKKSLVIDYGFLLGREHSSPLPPLHKSWFTLFCYSFCSSAKIPGCPCSSISSVTPQIARLLMLLCPRYPGVCRGSHWGTGHLRKHLWRRPKLLRTRQEGLGAPMIRAEIAEHPASSDPAQAALLFKI